jgi:SagB-type dehydrogenase family enzyme
VYRYDPLAHRLLLESEGDARRAVVKATYRQTWVGEASAILVFAAVYERTARKYGERAARYVHMEVGHAAQNVYLQAGALGLGTTMVGAFDDETLARAVGLPAQHRPLGLLPIGKPR